MQCHDFEYADLNKIVDETIPGLREIQARGKARFIGIRGYPLKILPYVMSRVEVDCVLTYCHYSLNNTAMRTLVSVLRERGTGIINATALSMGLLTNQAPPAWHPAPYEIRSACKRAAKFCRGQAKISPRLRSSSRFKKRESARPSLAWPVSTNYVGT
ncbi:MAG: aldo/keto reductase [Bryobacteraceae bacterium]